MIYNFDIVILKWLNSWVFWKSWVDITIVFRAVYLGGWMLAGLLAFGAFVFLPRFSLSRRRNWKMIFEAAAAALISRFGAVELIRFFYSRPRPFEVLPDIHQLVFRDGGGSFPSGHAAFYFAIALVVARYYPKTGILFFLAALNLSLARVQAGLHWPSDILGGAIIGIAVGFLVSSLVRRYARPRHSDR